MCVMVSLELVLEVVFEDEIWCDELYCKFYGVIVVIVLWNWLLMIFIWQIILVFYIGNMVVFKFFEYISVCGLELVCVIVEVLLFGVFNIVSGDGSVGVLLVEDVDINKIMFIGFGVIGVCIVVVVVCNFMLIIMELGGNDVVIVLEDVDFKVIVLGLFWGVFFNMGQICVCVKCFYVFDVLYDQIVVELKVIIVVMFMGDGLQFGIVMGLVQNFM